MILIQDVLISDDIIKENFICNLKACKGACCHEGDYGAPLTDEEINQIETHLTEIKKKLSPASIEKIECIGVDTYFDEPELQGTTLHEDGACVFMIQNELGIHICAIEKAYKEGKIPFNKPRSCHLYPIRVEKNPAVNFEAWNYDQWEICSAACDLGDKESIKIYQFLKNAIIDYKGKDFYEELDAAAQNLSTKVF